MKKILIFATIIIIIVIGLAIGLSKRALAPGSSKNTNSTPSSSTTQSADSNQASPETITTPKSELAEPVANFKQG